MTVLAVRRPSVHYVTDWTAVLDSLRRIGFTFQQLAAVLHIPKTTLLDYRSGATPKHPDGESLLDFYCHVTLSTRDQVPVKRRLPRYTDNCR